MPTIFVYMGFRFSFFSNEHEPIHIHVSKGGAHAKFNVLPVIKLVRNDGFKNSELKIIRVEIEKNKELIIQQWVKFFIDN